jgi:hypothetical protein
MKEINWNLITIAGGILLIVGLNSSPGIVGQGCFVIGGTIFGMGLIKRFTNWLDFPTDTKLSSPPIYISVPAIVGIGMLFTTLYSIAMVIGYILLNPKEYVSTTIVNMMFPIPANMALSLPPGFITTLLLILFVGIGGISILFPVLLISMPTFRNTPIVIGPGDNV